MAGRGAPKKPVVIPEVEVPMRDTIIPMYKPVLKDILQHGHTHYVFAGGR